MIQKMAQKTGKCTAIWNGERCDYEGPVVIHHLYRPSVTGKRGREYQQRVCKTCHDAAHDRFKGAKGGADDKWPDDPRFDGLAAPFPVGDLP